MKSLQYYFHSFFFKKKGKARKNLFSNKMSLFFLFFFHGEDKTSFDFNPFRWRRTLLSLSIQVVKFFSTKYPFFQGTLPLTCPLTKEDHECTISSPESGETLLRLYSIENLDSGMDWVLGCFTVFGYRTDLFFYYCVFQKASPIKW